MRLLLDECIGRRSLVRALKKAGHDVVRSIDAVGGGADDSAVFASAGVILVYQNGTPTDLTAENIVAAIANVEAVFPDGIAGAVLPLNGYRW